MFWVGQSSSGEDVRQVPDDGKLLPEEKMLAGRLGSGGEILPNFHKLHLIVMKTL